jgi:hypothetical protein
MFARAFYELHSQLDLHELFGQTDAGMIARLRSVAAGGPWEGLLSGSFGAQRRLYKRAAEFGHDQEDGGSVYTRLAGRPYTDVVQAATNLASRLLSKLGCTISPADILIDAPPAHREIEFAVDIYFPKQDTYRPLRRVSPVVDSLARTQFDEYVKRVRVFVSPELREAVSRIPQLDQIVEQAAAELARGPSAGRN